MKCKICGGLEVHVIYNGLIRDGAPGKMTTLPVPIYQCGVCDCIWHDPVGDSQLLYQSDDYRESMQEDVSLAGFYKKHDSEIIDKLNYTGTSIYRNKLFMDIGCGGGGYADYIRGVAQQVLLVEPNDNFSSQLREKGYEVFSYPEEALEKYKDSIELITSFDVIEHVDNPQAFLQTIFELLSEGGTAFIGTPTEYPVLRNLLGETFDSFLFSVQHPWVFSRKNLEILSRNCGFSSIEIEYYQRFGIGNLIAWLQTNRPCGDRDYSFVSRSFNSLYKAEMAKEETAEYLILKVTK